MATVKFKKAGRWAVSLETQIEVSEGEVVSDLPKEFAEHVVASDGGEIVEEKKALVSDDKEKAEKTSKKPGPRKTPATEDKANAESE